MSKRKCSAKMLPSIPERWANYKPLGRVINGTNIICFKVPLEEKHQRKNAEIRQVWDINALRHALPRLGAVIDLTNTTRYYRSGDFTRLGIYYTKINVPGKAVPSEEKVKKFIEAVDSFSNKDMLIGVHCTHGINRTGYMVCRYLKDRLNMSPQEAIKKFEKARGHRIERENYVEKLLGTPLITFKKPLFNPTLSMIAEQNLVGEDFEAKVRHYSGIDRDGNPKKKNKKRKRKSMVTDNIPPTITV